MDDDGTRSLWKRSIAMPPAEDVEDAVLRSTDPWRGARATPVQTVVAMPIPAPPGAIGSGQDVDGAARKLTHLFGRAMGALGTESHEAFRTGLDDLARAATALDGHFGSVEYRGQLRGSVERILGDAGRSMAAEGTGRPERDHLEVHHTVPYAAPAAEAAREILGKWNISIHDPANAAILTHGYHRGETVHGSSGDPYSASVVSSLREDDAAATRDAETEGRAVGRAEMFDALRALSDDVVAGSRDPLAISLEATLRAAERQMPRPDVPVPRAGPRLSP